MSNRVLHISLAVILTLSVSLIGCGGEQVHEYSLTISSTEGGSVTSPGELGPHTYGEGEVVDLVAKADAGYRFVIWTGDVSTIDDINAASTTITMHGDYAVRANFEKMPVTSYTLTTTVNGSGSTSPSVGQHTYTPGTVVSIIATPANCARFANWTGNVGTVGNRSAASTTITINGDYSITANFEENELVTFPDPNLEAAIRQATSKPEGPIYASDLHGLTDLNASTRNITDLTGLECAASLTVLYLDHNQISDISPLANLTNLTALWLQINQIDDISPLAHLTKLTTLGLSGLQISEVSRVVDLSRLTCLMLVHCYINDISPLANLTNLTGLYLHGNEISDISPVANLTNLTYLDLSLTQTSGILPLANLTKLSWLNISRNQISDISPLADLTNLEMLHLWDNQISDISPLVQNEGLSTGDLIWLWENPLSSASLNIYIPQLQARGVTVTY